MTHQMGSPGLGYWARAVILQGGAKIREEGKTTQAHQAEKKLLNLMLAPVRS